MKADFREFMGTQAVSPPQAISSSLQNVVNQDLNPNPWGVFSRLAAMHFFVALATLSLCPQFGIRLLGTGMGLMQYFMSLGDLGCGLCCGVLFLGGSLFLASLLLSPDQVRVIRKYRWLELGALTFLSLGVFAMLSSEIVVGFALAWAAGSILGGFATLEAGWLLRQRMLRN